MKTHFLSPLEILKIKTGQIMPEFSDEYFLLADSYFNLGIGYYQCKKLVKDVYLPLRSRDLLKDNFILFEILNHPKGILVRKRDFKSARGEILSPEDLAYYIRQNSKLYTTFSLEQDWLSYPFETILREGFSLINYCHEAEKGGGRIESISIVADPGGNLDHAYREGFAVYEFLSSLNFPFQLNFISNPLYSKDFDEILKNSSLVHFCGHIEDKGIWLGKEYYRPGDFQSPLAPFLFLNGCALPERHLLQLIQRKAKNLVYGRVLLEDEVVDFRKLQYFYLGLILGYRIGDVAFATLDFNKYRLYGWMAGRFTF